MPQKHGEAKGKRDADERTSSLERQSFRADVIDGVTERSGGR
jgi:hypothetical protein